MRKTKNKPPYSEYKHSLTFRVRRYTHLQCIRLQAYIRVCCHIQQNLFTDCKSAQSCTTRGHAPITIPPSYFRVRVVVWECGEGQTDRHTDGRGQYISPRLCFMRNFSCSCRPTASRIKQVAQLPQRDRATP